jgi:hypothetical protein
LEFLGAKEVIQKGVAGTALKNQAGCFALGSTDLSTTAQLSDEQIIGQPQQLSHPLMVAEDRSREVSDNGIHTHKHQGRLLLTDGNLLHCEGLDFPEKCRVPSQKVGHGRCKALGLVEQGQVADVIGDFSYVEGEIDNLNDNYDSTDCARMCLATNYLAPIDATMIQGTKSGMNCTDDRDITAAQLLAKACENDTLSPQQREDLYELLLKYQPHFTKRPGRCNVFEYKFEIEGEMPSSANSRPIPFALRAQV